MNINLRLKWWKNYTFNSDISNVGRYKFNKKLGLRGRIAGFALAAPVADPMTGEIIAEAGEVLRRERAEEIAEAGVNDVYLDVDGKSIRVFGNGMVDMKHYVDFDPAELGVKELVRGVILRQLMEQYEGARSAPYSTPRSALCWL